MSEVLEVTLHCPVCRDANVLPLLNEEKSGSFFCRVCGCRWSMLHPKVVGYRVREVRRSSFLENFLYGFILGWLLRR